VEGYGDEVTAGYILACVMRRDMKTDSETLLMAMLMVYRVEKSKRVRFSRSDSRVNVKAPW
jgi:hypothetical protein